MLKWLRLCIYLLFIKSASFFKAFVVTKKPSSTNDGLVLLSRHENDIGWDGQDLLYLDLHDKAVILRPMKGVKAI